jgi:hypothetical protein
MSDKLSAEERAYFESGGESEIPAVEKEVSGGMEAGEPEEMSSDEPDEAGGVTSPDDVTPLEDKQRTKQVPHAALHAERERRKALEVEYQKAREEAAAFRGKLELLAEAMRKPQQEEPAPVDDGPPDPDKDIFAFAKWQAERTKQLEAQLRERAEAERKAQETTQVERQIWSKWDEDTAKFAAEKPDFNDARTFLAQKYDAILEADARFDPSLAQKANRDRAINEQLKRIVAQSAQAGINSAELIYEYAVRYGYQAKSTENPVQMASKRVEELNKAQAANKSLSDAGGRGSAEFSADEILAMSDKELTRWLNKSTKNREFFDRLLGA